jgi:hypothetical protein
MDGAALDAFMLDWMKTHDRGLLPGAMLMRYGPENYIGAALAVRATLYFEGSYKNDVREAICTCFDRYESIANIAAVELDAKPAIYVLPNQALKKIRIAKIESLHYGSQDGEPRLAGAPAERWLTRFDVPEDELLAYKAKLLKEPKLTAETTLPEVL